MERSLGSSRSRKPAGSWTVRVPKSSRRRSARSCVHQRKSPRAARRRALTPSIISRKQDSPNVSSTCCWKRSPAPRDTDAMARAQPTLEHRQKTEAWWRMLWSDYTAHYSYKHESDVRRCLLAAPRIASNGSLPACLLLRLTLAGPTASRWSFRRVLLLTHGCDFAPTAQIGAGLQL